MDDGEKMELSVIRPSGERMQQYLDFCRETWDMSTIPTF